MKIKNLKGVFKNTVVSMACLICLFSTVQNLAAQKNDYTIISADKDAVKFKIAAGKTLYDVKIVSGSQSFSFKDISNESGNLVMPNGSTFLPGSDCPQPSRFGHDSYSFPDGATVKVSGFGAPDGFKPQKVLIVPKRGVDAIEYTIKK